MESSVSHNRPRPSSALVWLTLLSLDAPIVAVLWQRLFARSLGLRLGWAVTAALGIVVWLLYVLDRVLDSLRSPATDADPLRHRFYRANRRFFLPPFIAALAAGAWIAFRFLSANTVETGLILMLAVGVYFFSVHFRPVKGESRLPKEFVVGVLFAAGSTFPVWRAMPGAHKLMLPALLIFALLCWTNCAAIEYSERKTRAVEGSEPAADPKGLRQAEEDSTAPDDARETGLHPSTVWLGSHLQGIGIVMTFGALALLLLPSLRSAWPLYAAEAGSAAAIFAVARQARRLEHDLFRVLMDVALFTPAIFLAILAAK